MALITTPAVHATAMQLQLVRGDTAIEFLDGSAAIAQSTKALWQLSYPIKPLRLADARPWAAALVQLSKLGNTFEVYPPAWIQGAGYAGAAPEVIGSAQLGLSLNCDTAGISTTVALAGDFITVNGETKMLTVDAVSNGTGLVTFTFEPALRASPADNATVNVLTPTITMRLITPAALVAARLGNFYDVTIEAIEHHGP